MILKDSQVWDLEKIPNLSPIMLPIFKVPQRSTIAHHFNAGRLSQVGYHEISLVG